MSAGREVKVSLVGDAASLERALNQGSKSLAGIEKSTHLATKAALGFAAFKGAQVAGDFLKDAAKAAAADETAMTRDGVAVKNAGENWKKLKEPVSEALAKMSTASGFMKHDLATAFSKLELATHDHTKALALENDAMNIAAQTGKPLQAISLALGKAYDGNAGALKRIGIITPKVTTEQDKLGIAHSKYLATHKKLTQAYRDQYKDSVKAAKITDSESTATLALKTAHEKFAGAVEARSQTMAGKLAIFQAKWEEIKVRIGDVILPYIIQGLSLLMSAFDSLDTFVENNKTLVEALGVVIGIVAAGVIAYEVAIKAAEVAHKLWAVATGIQTGAQWLLNAALDANPIGIVVIAIGALVAAMVVLYTQSGTVRTIINDAFGSIKRVGKEVIGWFTDTAFPAFNSAWNTAGGVVNTAVGLIKGYVKLGLDPVLGAINVVKDLLNGDFSQAWTDIKTTVGKVFSDIDQALGGLPGKLLGYVKDVDTSAAKIGQAIFDSITGALTGLAGSITGTIKDAINAMIGTANKGFNVITDHWPDIPGAPGPPFGHDPIPKLAAGGIVTRPTIALIGEAGPEAVIPLGRGGMGAGVHIANIDMRGTGGDPGAFSRRLMWDVRMAARGA